MIGIVIEPNRGTREIEIGGPDDGLAAMQSAVGGYIEMTFVPLQPPLLIWTNEDGHRLGLPVNDWASMFLGHTVVGPVIVTGGDVNGDGDISELPERWRIFLPGGAW
jgi:hypothetical protein